MAPEATSLFAALPRLQHANATAASIPCKVCGVLAPFFDVVDFNKTVSGYDFGPSGITVPWHHCRACGFLFTALCDDWTPGEFRRFIYNDDYPSLDPDYLKVRPQRTAKRVEGLLADHRDARILDYGAGNGVFAACMRDAGFRHVAAYDPISMPDRPTGPFDIITCVEVIEHSPRPAETVADMASLLDEDGAILLGETLQPPDIDTIRCSWWYCAIRNGHVSTYADRTFVELGRRAGLAFHRSAGDFHVLRRGLRFAKLAERVGPALAFFQLGAPGRRSADGFSGVEDIPGFQFQWTIAETIRWPLTIPPGISRVQIMVPFRHESRARFAAECMLELNGAAAPTTIRESSLCAEFNVQALDSAMVTLRTPPPTPGRERTLGIALRVVRAVAE
jgi:SAM-dependent methyltransferase